MFEVLIALSFLPIFVLSLFVLFAIRRTRESEKRLIRRDLELSRKMYELAVLKEVGERIGYSLDVGKIIDIITGSLRKLFPYTTASSAVISDGKVVFKCDVEESVNRGFINSVKEKIFSALAALGVGLDGVGVDEVLTGTILDDEIKPGILSYFNIPLVINGKIVGIINIASTKNGIYKEEETSLLYRITKHSADAVSRLYLVLETEKGKVVSLVSSMADGVIMTDKDTRLVVINPAAKRMLNIEKETATIFDVIESLTGKFDLRTRIEESMRLEKLLIHDELYIADKVLQLLVSPVKDNAGKTLGSVVIFHDITNEKQLERLREDFTAMMVHELRAPLTALRGTSDTMMRHLKELTPEKIENSLRLLRDSSTQMLGLVNDLLDVAKIEAGKFEVAAEPANLNQVITDVVTSFKSLALEKGIDLETEISPSLPEAVYFDRFRISQVLNNLLSNALKFTNVGKITVSAKREGDGKILVAVADTGEGIPQEQLSSLFNKFKQLEVTSGRSFGTGLGLVISRGIIESHGGRFWVDSKVGQGSTFYFNLPVSMAALESGSKSQKNRFFKGGKML